MTRSFRLLIGGIVAIAGAGAAKATSYTSDDKLADFIALVSMHGTFSNYSEWDGSAAGSAYMPTIAKLDGGGRVYSTGLPSGNGTRLTELYDMLKVAGVGEPFTIGSFFGTAPVTANNVLSSACPTGSGTGGCPGGAAGYEASFSTAYNEYAFGGGTEAIYSGNEDQDLSASTAEARFRRQIVDYLTGEAPGTVIIDTPNTYLYYVLGNGRAIRYGIGVGREGFTWSGTQSISRKAEWPDWTAPPDMLLREPDLPRFVAGGPQNPLGARAMYLGDTLYRIHGTNAPTTIGGRVSAGCIRLTNDDVIDLYGRVKVGTKVVVLPAEPLAARGAIGVIPVGVPGAIGGTPVGAPGPIAGAGLPGLAFAGGFLIWWRWRRKLTACGALAAA